MSQRLKAVNDELKQLGDAWRLGQIPREEYRSRRRHLLGGFSDADVATARKPVANQAAAPAKPAARARSDAPSASSSSARPMPRPYTPPVAAPASAKSGSSLGLRIALLGVLIVGLIGVLVWLMQMQGDGLSAGGPAAPVAATGTADPAAALEARASAFVDDNRWEPADIEAFLSVWRASDAKVRAAAAQSPALLALRHQVTDKLKYTRVLLDDAAPGSGKLEQARAIEALDRALAAAP